MSLPPETDAGSAPDATGPDPRHTAGTPTAVDTRSVPDDRPVASAFAAFMAASLGIGLAWVAIRLRIPFPVGVFVWAGVAYAIPLAGQAVLRAAWARTGPERFVAVPIGVLAVLLTVPMFLYSPFIAGYLTNDIRLSAFADHLYSLPEPPGTRVHRGAAEVGLLDGNGDHCDFLVTLGLTSEAELSLRDIERYYERLGPPSAVPQLGASPVRVYATEDTTEPSDGRGYRYLVGFDDSGYEGSLDFRCM